MNETIKKLAPNERGFMFGEFKDLYGKDCSIQGSSLATQPAIWLGCDEGLHTKGAEGEEVCLARMHLTQDMVAELIPLLVYFMYHGSLPSVEEDEDNERNGS